MNKKTITPNPKQPVERKPAGQLPNILAELSEESLGSGSQAQEYNGPFFVCFCSYDGDDE
ncbi:MAG: DUF5837 family cyanobactin class RiPP [Cyanobacteriota bacterium]|nr:DUF5837 family cyanobactin class RiPP [Cyanobacteriota bacterium]